MDFIHSHHLCFPETIWFYFYWPSCPHWLAIPPTLHSPATSLFSSSYKCYCYDCGLASKSIRGVADLCSVVCHCSASYVDTNPECWSCCCHCEKVSSSHIFLTNYNPQQYWQPLEGLPPRTEQCESAVSGKLSMRWEQKCSAWHLKYV